MKLHELKPAAGSRKARKRVGRGPGSGGVECDRTEGQVGRLGIGDDPTQGIDWPCIRHRDGVVEGLV